jgi:hypothetical protein
MANIFFIMATGRSGTRWLADILNTDPNARVYHENFKKDVKAFVRCYRNPKRSERYVSVYREKEILKQSSKVDVYGEVNGFLRVHIRSLKKHFPKAQFIQLVRFPPDVIRSMYSKHGSLIDKIRDKKPKINWIMQYWASESKITRNQCGKFFRLEDLTTDWEKFSELAEMLGLVIDQETWESKRVIRKNKCAEYLMPEFRDWDKHHKEKYIRHCWDEAKYYGYHGGDN